MGNDLLLSRNLHILLHLKDGSATLEELAEIEHCGTGLLSVPLKVLESSGLVIKDKGMYRLSDGSQVEEVLSLIEPWLSYQDKSYYGLAQDTAKIIHTKSWEEAGVQDVVLFGSCIRGDRPPNDIDMLILHNGRDLREFDPNPYETDVEFLSDQPAAGANQRSNSRYILCRLGYRHDPRQDTATFHNRSSLETELKKDSAFNNIIARTKQLTGDGDVEKMLDEIFDIHAMSTKLYDPKNNTGREEAIARCRDPTFWYTVLSEGRIYDLKQHDFLIPVEEKYPGVLSLFQPDSR